MAVPKNMDNAGTREFNDFTYSEEEEFLENEINFDENGDIVFHPTGLYYHDCPLSITAAREFEITNSMNNPVTIFTVRSSNRQFHSTLSKNQEITGGGKLKVNILYLPHQTEFLTADLTIVTSRGEYIMPISANSVKNPYKIDPQLGIRFPASSSSTDTLEKPIIVFNPHQETLHITEVFTTENFLALKGAAFQGVGSDPDAPASDKIKPRTDTEGQRVVSDGTSGSNNSAAAAHTLWSIPPGGEKEIITLTVSKDLPPGLHSGFLHIKTDHANLVMPVELTALNTLVYPPHEELNFGVLPTAGSRNTLDLWINNFGDKNVEVLEIILVNPDPNMRVELVSVPVIYAGASITSRVAKLHYTAAHAGQVSNKLLVITNNTNAASAVIEIRYRANVMHGGIRFNNENTLFRIEVFNQTYPFECSHCDTHGSRLGFNDDLYSALLDDYYLKQNLLTNANANTNTHTNTHTTTNTHDTQHVHATNTYSTHTHTHTTPHEHPYEDGLAERADHVITHTLTIQNCFPTAAYIMSVAHNCEEFLFTDFTPPTSADVVYNADRTVVNNYETWRPIRVTLKAALVYALYRESPDFLPKMCHLDVTTNISTHRVPIYIATGALSIEFMDMVRCCFCCVSVSWLS